ncbi:MAG: hypothetical protein R2747_09085 [Pyrinomonadaceae bacterium]
MENSTKMAYKFLISILALSISTFCHLSISAQKSPDWEMVKLPPPVQESFVEATGLVTPWIASGCSIYWSHSVPNCRFILTGPPRMNCETVKYRDGDILRKLPNCFYVSREELKGKEITELYNNDGSLWLRFSNKLKAPDYFGKMDEKPELLPFAYDRFNTGAAVLRIVSESPNWYEVEINEGTRATKFVWKKDSNWTTMTWDYWLGKEFELYQKSALKDKPDGEIIEESANLTFDYYAYFNKTEGDWVFVKGVTRKSYPKEYTGWIRWRRGRHILFMTNTNANQFR